jgi:hypothetical protein
LPGTADFKGPVPDDRDPFEIVDDLMAVVELLCPVYLQREVFGEDDEWRL